MRMWCGAAATAGVLTWSGLAGALAPVEVIPHAGVQLGGYSNNGVRTADLETSVSYGIAADYRLLPYAFLRASYHRQPTYLTIRDVDVGELQVPLSTGYLQLGGTYEHGLGRVRAIVALTAGASHFTPSADQYGEEWYFAAAGELALKIGILDYLGMRVHTRLMLDVMSRDSRLFCGESPGACEYNFGGEVMGQGELGFGIWMAF